jgi:pectinesterase
MVYPGIYTEQLTITESSITIKGSTYLSLNPRENPASMAHGIYASEAGSNDKSATLFITGANFKMYNMDVTNSAGTERQAVVLSVSGVNQGFYACALMGWQDTLYSHTGTQYFSRCYIEGAIDFIFGLTAQSWYQGVSGFRDTQLEGVLTRSSAR